MLWYGIWQITDCDQDRGGKWQLVFPDQVGLRGTETLSLKAERRPKSQDCCYCLLIQKDSVQEKQMNHRERDWLESQIHPRRKPTVLFRKTWHLLTKYSLEACPQWRAHVWRKNPEGVSSWHLIVSSPNNISTENVHLYMCLYMYMCECRHVCVHAHVHLCVYVCVCVWYVL